MTSTFYLTTIEQRGTDDIQFWGLDDAANRTKVAAHCRDNWKRVFGEEEPIPDADDELIQLYFCDNDKEWLKEEAFPFDLPRPYLPVCNGQAILVPSRKQLAGVDHMTYAQNSGIQLNARDLNFAGRAHLSERLGFENASGLYGWIDDHYAGRFDGTVIFIDPPMEMVTLRFVADEDTDGAVEVTGNTLALALAALRLAVRHQYEEEVTLQETPREDIILQLEKQGEYRHTDMSCPEDNFTITVEK